MSGITMQFVGRLISDPEVKYLPSGKGKVMFSVAVSRGRKGADGRYKTDVVDVESFREVAIAFTMESLHKGDQVLVVGKFEKEVYEAEGGAKRSTWLCNANEVSGVGPRWNDGGQGEGGHQPPTA